MAATSHIEEPVPAKPGHQCRSRGSEEIRGLSGPFISLPQQPHHLLAAVRNKPREYRSNRPMESCYILPYVASATNESRRFRYSGRASDVRNQQRDQSINVMSQCGREKICNINLIVWMQLSLSDWRKMRNPRLSSGTQRCPVRELHNTV